MLVFAFVHKMGAGAVGDRDDATALMDLFAGEIRAVIDSVRLAIKNRSC